MLQSVRSALRQTRVVTVAGRRLGWLADLEVDLFGGQVQKFRIIRSRWRPWSTLGWIDRSQVHAWEPGKLVVQDGVAALEKKVVRTGIGLPASAPSCYVKRS